MIVLDHAQGSAEWIQARLGIPTASAFSRILTNKTLKVSAQAEGYIDELCAEWALGAPVDAVVTDFIERGTELEQQAVDWYQFDRGLDVHRVGLCLRDDRRLGASPDGLIGAEGGIEIKCPSAKVHIGYLRGAGVEDEYRHQVQGGIYVCERAWWDVLSYNPVLPPCCVRVYRDEAYLAQLVPALEEFLQRLEDAKEQLRREHGVVPAEEREAQVRGEREAAEDAWLEGAGLSPLHRQEEAEAAPPAPAAEVPPPAPPPSREDRAEDEVGDWLQVIASCVTREELRERFAELKKVSGRYAREQRARLTAAAQHRDGELTTMQRTP